MTFGLPHAILIIILIVCSAWLFLVSFSRHAGPIFKPTSFKKVKLMISLAKVKKGDLVVDLGSGDGRILIEAAKRGAKAIGYEIDPFLVLKSRKEIKKAGLSNLAKVYWKSFWLADLKEPTVITTYLFPKYMDKLYLLLKKNRPTNLRLVSNRYQFSRKKSIKSKNGIYLYLFNRSS
ncbi:MAG: methyltransferase domain-containing protein [Patescibacteria group bacterium]|nr:class I SAM-dependent methyltransferase [Patescibacteria group bacterium]